MSATAASPYKVHVKLGQAEFEAEGPEQTVKEQLTSFLELAAVHQVMEPTPTPAHNGHANGNGTGNGNFNSHTNGYSEKDPTPTSVTQAMIGPEIVQRLFAEDNGLVSIKRLPVGDERESDVLFLILLGYLLLKNQERVKASELLAAAKQSGIRLIRIDHVLDKFDVLVTRGGFKRGSFYCLTNPGQEHAKEIARRIFS